MITISLLIKQILLILSVGVLLTALYPIRKLIKQLPVGVIRTKWYVLNGLILLFIIGYLNYTIVYWSDYNTIFDIIVPVVFFFGAIFVLLAGILSLQTALDIRRISTLEQETITDPLMGINNRRYFDRRLNEEIVRANRHSLPLSMLLLDIDHFKKINDTYGHHIGDIVLVGLANLLKTIVREIDVLTRYGGEEIAIITPQTTISSASGLANRINKSLAETILARAVEHNLDNDIIITMSIGMAGLDEQTTDSTTLLKHADDALYYAKESGRNRSIIYNDIPQ